MIKHRKKIVIKANNEKVWFFISDLSRSLIFDKYYTLVELPSNYSINKDLIFFIYTKYFFKIKKCEAKIVNTNAPLSLEIACSSPSLNVFNHTKKFVLKSFNDKTELTYILEGSFHKNYYNIFYNYLIKIAFNLELQYIKKAIESSETNHNIKKMRTATKNNLY